MPDDIPECMLLLATLTLRSKVRDPLRLLVIEIWSGVLATESRQTTRFGCPIKCLYVYM